MQVYSYIEEVRAKTPVKPETELFQLKELGLNAYKIHPIFTDIDKCIEYAVSNEIVGSIGRFVKSDESQVEGALVVLSYTAGIAARVFHSEIKNDKYQGYASLVETLKETNQRFTPAYFGPHPELQAQSMCNFFNEELDEEFIIVNFGNGYLVGNIEAA